MITLALPWVFGLALAGALAITALHLLSVRRPPELLLPTARFVPDRVVRAVSRAKRPSDVVLLLVRIAVLLAASLAAAQPRWTTTSSARVVLVVIAPGVMRDTATIRALVSNGALAGTSHVRVEYVYVDSAVNADVDPAALMPTAWRAAAVLAAQDAAIDSFDLRVLLSRASMESDAGLTVWRDAWPGRMVLYQPAVAAVTPRLVIVAADSVAARASDDDVVRRAFAWHARYRAARGVDTMRSGSSRIDTIALSRGDITARPLSDGTSHIRVFWPLRGVPAGWRATSTHDSTSALIVAGQALMGPWPVTATRDSSDTGRPIAWWGDGRVAAVEHRTVSSCDRVVAVVSAVASDALFAASANGLFERLLAPCHRAAPVPVVSLLVHSLDRGPLADADQFRQPHSSAGALATSSSDRWIVSALYAVALLMLVAEWRLRKRVPEVLA